MVPLFAVTAWSIWHHQNKSRIQEHSLPLERIASFAEDYLRGFKTLDRPKQKTRRTVLKKWSPPILGSLKTNFDGAMFGESDEAGLRVVICNSEGEIMATLSGKKKPFVETLELLAARRAVGFSLKVGFLAQLLRVIQKLL